MRCRLPSRRRRRCRRLPLARPNLQNAASHSSIELENIASVFICPLCYGYILPPVLQCPIGHSICASCTPQYLTYCLICNHGPINNRNLSLDNLADIFLLPCKYSKWGCRIGSLLANIVAHEMQCKFRPAELLPCLATSNCTWSGTLPQYRDHFLKGHGLVYHQGNNGIFDMHIMREPLKCYWSGMITHDYQDFVIFVYKEWVPFAGMVWYYITVKRLGETEPNVQYECQMKFINPVQQLKFQFEPDKLLSDRSRVLHTGPCIVLSGFTLQEFCYDGRVRIFIRMTKKTTV